MPRHPSKTMPRMIYANQKPQPKSGSWWIGLSRPELADAALREADRMRASRDGQQSLGKAPLGVGNGD
jgi:hypothetical protein